jgi:hypothetical protein
VRTSPIATSPPVAAATRRKMPAISAVPSVVPTVSVMSAGIRPSSIVAFGP